MTDPFVPVAEAPDPGSARVYAAMLQSAGIPVRLHGEALGPYVVTVGDWAITRLWVPESMHHDAVEMLRAEDAEPGLVLVPRDRGS